MPALLILLLTLLSGTAVAGIPDATFRLKPAAGSTSGLEVEFRKAGAFTLGKIYRGGLVVLRDNGWNGQVIRQVEPGNWIGTGHPEGGTETPQTLALVVDGKDVPLNQDTTAVDYVSSFMLTKHSLLQSKSGERAELHVRIRLEQGVLHEAFRLKILDAISITRFYAFMHCWPPTSAEYHARDFGGGVHSGLSKEGHLDIDPVLDFFAFYNPGKAPYAPYVTLTKFREDFQHLGKDINGTNLCNINSRIYHKQYTRPIRERHDLAAGSTYEAAMAFTFIDAPDHGAWKQSAEAAAQTIVVAAPAQQLEAGGE